MTTTLATSPATLSFASLAGGAAPASQNATLSETGGTGTAWTSATVYTSGAAWLTFSPTSGTLAGNGSQVVGFTCSTTLLKAGTYTATVTFTATTGGSTATVAVTLTVPFSIQIAGSQILFDEESFQLHLTADEHRRCQFTVLDYAGTQIFRYRQRVIVADAVKGVLFSGYVVDVKQDKRNMYPGPGIEHEIDTVDHWSDANKRTSKWLYANQQAGVIAVDQIQRFLAAEGITAAAALDWDEQLTDWQAGTLSNTTATSNAFDANAGDGDLELSPAGTVVTYNDPHLSLSSTPTIKMTGYASQGFNNSYCYRQIWSGSQLISSGDAFTYDVWISSTSPAIVGGMDFVCTDGTTFRDSALVGTDQQGLGSHPSTDLAGLANDQWYSRSCGVSGALIGKTIAYATVVFEGEATGTYTMYIRNAYWFNGVTVKKHFFDTTQNTLQSNKQLQIQGYSNIAISVVNSYDKTATQTVGPHAIGAAAIVQSSQFSWSVPASATLDAAATIAFQTSIDSGATYQAVLNNAAIPNLIAGMSVGSRNMQYQCILTCGVDPTLPPSVSAIQVVVNPSYVASKTDVISTTTTQANFNAGTKTNTKSLSPNGLTNNGFTKAFSSTSDYNGVTTVFGNTANEFLYLKSLQLQAIASFDARSRLDFAGTWQNFTAEVDIQVPGSGGGVGLEYRTTNFGNSMDSYAYSATVNLTTVLLGKGTNSSGAGSFTSLATASIPGGIVNDSWHHLKIIINGSSHQIYLDDVLYITHTDGSYSAAGNISLRYYNSAVSQHQAGFANFGVISNLVGTWVTPSISLAAAGTYGNSIIEWDTSQIPGTAVIGAETSINGGSTYTAVTNGGQIAGLSPGDSLAAKSLLIRMTLTCASASYQSTLNGVTVWIAGQFSSSGTRISPLLALTAVGRAGTALVNWNAIIPTNTSLAVATSLSGAAYQAVATPGAAISGINAQSTPTIDTFTADTHTSYTSTFVPTNSAATWTYDTANSRITAVGGAAASFISNLPTGVADIDMFVDLDKSEAGGCVWRWSNSGRMYQITIADASAAVHPNSIYFNKYDGGTKFVYANTSINFLRGMVHRFRVTMIGAVVTVYMDGVQVIQITDAFTPIASGQCGLWNDGGTAQFYQLTIQPQGDDVTAATLRTRVTLTSTDPTATPQLLDMQLFVASPAIGAGTLIPAVDYTSTFVDKNQDDLAKQSNYMWWIDQALAFNFQGRQAQPAPWILSSNTLAQPSDLEVDTNLLVESAGGLYRNRQTLRNVIDTGPFTDPFIGDGQKTSFSLRYQIAVGATPTITLNGQVQTVGAATSAATGSQWYYTAGSVSIAQDGTGTVLTAFDTLIVKYTGSFLTDITVNNGAAQAALSIVEGGSGIVEAVLDVSSMNMTATAGTVYANQLLIRYCVTDTSNLPLGRTITYKTYRDGLAVAQIQAVFVPEEHLSNVQLLINQIDVAMQTQPGNTVLYNYLVSASELPNTGGWSKLFASGLLD